MTKQETVQLSMFPCPSICWGQVMYLGLMVIFTHPFENDREPSKGPLGPCRDFHYSKCIGQFTEGSSYKWWGLLSQIIWVFRNVLILIFLNLSFIHRKTIIIFCHKFLGKKFPFKFQYLMFYLGFNQI